LVRGDSTAKSRFLIKIIDLRLFDGQFDRLSRFLKKIIDLRLFGGQFDGKKPVFEKNHRFTAFWRAIRWQKAGF